jgi:hypothetical protein
LDQFVKALASNNHPAVTEQHVRDMLCDMVQTGFLDKQGEVYLPASEGWDFIESNRIYANIQANPLEVALVDVESGQTVATVAGFRDSSGGIRVAGRSYNLVPGGSPFLQRVRSGGDHVDSPKYHARTLPYAFDVGASMMGYFSIRPDEIVTIRVGQSLVVMTWLGRLLNAVLGDGFKKHRLTVSVGSFSITVILDEDRPLLPLIRETTQEVVAENPLEVSQVLQGRAREDWLDHTFLQSWCDHLSEIRILPADSELAEDLLQLV